MRPDPTSIRIVALDDHAFVRRGMEAHLAHTPGLELVGVFAHSRDLPTSVMYSCCPLKLTSSTPRCFDGAGGHLVNPRLTARWMMQSIAFQLSRIRRLTA
ncbi:hypothetical protein Bsp3421_001030 [Burkholderia sp. FERM BP-3421]|nr:hypothetical protein [Burkholderia sp. FERM BP-3421]WDD91135.1 hypothetical protein Bsp3421_001030 [Burkholderia sp. FERM BP-3421]